MRSICAAAILAASLTASDSNAGETYFTGLGHVFSLGICSVGPGDCRTHLSVESYIEETCAARPKDSIRLAGHSLGASAAMRAVHGLAECGVKVDAVAMLDPMIHPYDMPRGTRWLALYSAPYWGVGEGKPGAIYVGGGHIELAHSPSILRRVRAFLGTVISK